MIEKQEVQELFPTPLWVVDLKPAEAAPLNAKLKAEIEKLISPRPKVPAGSNWQTPQDLHKRPAFADFVKLVEMAARGVARFLQVDQYPMVDHRLLGQRQSARRLSSDAPSSEQLSERRLLRRGAAGRLAHPVPGSAALR